MIFYNLADEIICYFIKYKKININEREVYTYGMEFILLNLADILITLIIAFFSQTWWHFISFILIFIPLRITCGGYHCKSSEVCFVVSAMVYLFTVLLDMVIKSLSYWNIGICLTCFLVVVLLAPIENENNILDMASRKKNKIASVVFISVDSIIFIILMLFFNQLSVSVLIFILLECLLMLIEFMRIKLKN